MISAVILARSDEDALSLTLSALAPAAMDGLVREVIVIDDGSNERIAEVADEAGARRVIAGAAADLAIATASAKQPWLLILTAGARPQVGWESAARGHMSHFADRAGRFRLSLAAPGVMARLKEARAELGASWLGRLTPEQGLLIAACRYTAPPRRLRRLEARVLFDRWGGA